MYMYITHFDGSGLGGLVGMGRRKLVENTDEFIQEGLTLHTKKEVFEVVIVQLERPAAVAPELHCRDVHVFFSHTGLDSSRVNTGRGPAKKSPACDLAQTDSSKDLEELCLCQSKFAVRT